MAMTALGDLFVSANGVVELEVIQSFMDENGDRAMQMPFSTSGAVITNPLVDAAASSASPQITVPYMGKLDSSVEPNYGNDVYEDVAIPHKLDSGFMQARNAYLNEAWGAMDLVQEITKKDPLAAVAARLSTFWAEQAENRIAATVRGIYELESGNADFNTQVAAGGSVSDGLLDAQMAMGSNFGVLSSYIMDLRTFTRLKKENLAAYDRDPETAQMTARFNGLPIIISNKAMTNTAGDSIVTLVGSGAFAYGMSESRVPLAYEREEARGNGHGAETLWSRRNMVVHPMGYNFLSTEITGNGTETVARSAGWADLINPANWERAVQREAIPLAFATIDYTA